MIVFPLFVKQLSVELCELRFSVTMSGGVVLVGGVGSEVERFITSTLASLAATGRSSQLFRMLCDAPDRFNCCIHIDGKGLCMLSRNSGAAGLRSGEPLCPAVAYAYVEQLKIMQSGNRRKRTRSAN